MKRMTKWLAVCAACMAFSVPAMAAEMPGVTVTPTPVETPDITPIETPTPTQKPQVKNGWYTYASKNKRYYKDGQYLTGMRKVQGKIYYFSPKGFMKTGWIKQVSNFSLFDILGFVIALTTCFALCKVSYSYALVEFIFFPLG